MNRQGFGVFVAGSRDRGRVIWLHIQLLAIASFSDCYFIEEVRNTLYNIYRLPGNSNCILKSFRMHYTRSQAWACAAIEAQASILHVVESHMSSIKALETSSSLLTILEETPL
jgi:hypothetical protein